VLGALWHFQFKSVLGALWHLQFKSVLEPCDTFKNSTLDIADILMTHPLYWFVMDILRSDLVINVSMYCIIVYICMTMYNCTSQKIKYLLCSVSCKTFDIVFYSVLWCFLLFYVLNGTPIFWDFNFSALCAVQFGLNLKLM
jgi:hypothetical protein